MVAPTPKPKRPRAGLRAVLAIWLLLWALLIFGLVSILLDAQTLVNWPVAIGGIGLMAAGWLVVFFWLIRLQRRPPK